MDPILGSFPSDPLQAILGAPSTILGSLFLYYYISKTYGGSNITNYGSWVLGASQNHLLYILINLQVNM